MSCQATLGVRTFGLTAAFLLWAPAAWADCAPGAAKTATTMAKTAKAAYDAGDYGKAMHLYSVAYGTCARGDWVLCAGRAAHVAGQLDKAIEYYAVYATAADREPALVTKSETYLAQAREARADELATMAQRAALSGDHAMAAATWANATKLQPARVDLWLQAGIEAQAADRREDAVNALRMYMSRAPLEALERSSARERLRQLGVYVTLFGNPESAELHGGKPDPATRGTTQVEVSVNPTAGTPAQVRFRVGRFQVDTETGTVTDEQAGLVWQRDVAAVGVRSFDDARGFCEHLHSGGQGWRLPSLVELRGLVDTTQTAARIDPKAFPDTPTQGFWTTTPAAGELGAFWRVNFASGGAGQVRSTELQRLRCVRVNAAQTVDKVAVNKRYQVDTTVGTVYDAKTRLTWQRNGLAGGQRSWIEAGAYCAGLELSGRGWRVPSLDELKSIVDDDRLNPAIDVAAFPDTPTQGFWTSTPYRLPISDAWFVDFRDGSGSVFRSVEAQLRVRCVR